MSEPAIVDALCNLGFNLNDARAYHALLRHGASTGYEVGQRAAIPRSAVYTALRKLVEEGAARAVRGTPERFLATPPEQVLAKLKKRFEASVTNLRDAAARLDVAPDTPDAFTVRGYDRILEEAARIVHGAKRTLVLAGWPRELSRLTQELKAADARGVYAVLFSHAALPSDLVAVHFSYGMREADLEQFWQHRLVVVADDERCLLGATEQNESDSAVISEAKAIAEIAVSQVSLDITLLSLRHGADVAPVMARVLGERVGRLDALFAKQPKPSLGDKRGGDPTPTKRKGK